MDYVVLCIFLIIIIFLYNRYQNKLNLEKRDSYSLIRKYLINTDENDNLRKNKKPIIWLYLDYEYNARNWLNFGSRSSHELNQPYFFITIKSIIHHCGDDFHICLIDHKSFRKLIPNWSINMTKISNPVKMYMKNLAMMKILHIYGGFIVPPSFLCFRNLKELYMENENNVFMFDGADNKQWMSMKDNYPSNAGTEGSNRSDSVFPKLEFMGSRKKSDVIASLIRYMEREISQDYTADMQFEHKLAKWCIHNPQIKRINGKLIGVKTKEGETIDLDNLFSTNEIEFHKHMYGILIPAGEILARPKYEWFSRMSAVQVLESDMIISRYMRSVSSGFVKERPELNTNKWVGWWQVPSHFSLYGMKPQPFATNLIMTNKPPPKP